MGGNPNVRFNARAGAFTLSAKGVAARIIVDSSDWPGVVRAAGEFQGDILSVSGQRASVIASSPKILVGSIGHSPLIDRLIQVGVLNVQGVVGKWEASVTQVVDVPNEGRCLVVAGADKRGTIYALYDLSESIGVSPWNWWSDVPVKHHDSLYVTGRYVAKSPAIKYRGIFLNDEAPSLSNWVYANYGDYRHAFYERVFELLLRLRANYLWPAMWNNSFSVDDPLNPKLADDYGIVMGTSHVEPMMRADKEWNRLGYKDRQWNYSTNPNELEKFWRDGIIRNKPYENIVTIAMRGKVDTPMSESANIDLLERIVAAQRRILAEVVSPDVTQIPQLWCLYKEVQEYYEKGMRVPDDVTLLWADDNWGDIRRLPTPEERLRSGGAGVYYHFDYVGGPRNYKWIDTNPISKVWEQMILAYRYGADRIWIVNVGDLQPKAFSTEFFLTMARDPNAIKRQDLDGHTRHWAEREFGQKYARDIAQIISETSRLNGRRKPELLGPDTYSLVNYREAERVSAEFEFTLKSALGIGKQLAVEYQPAYYELVIHPLKAAQVINDLYLSAARNALYSKQGRASAVDQAKCVRDLFSEDAQVTAEYHSINGGKWNHFMDQTHIGYTSWQQPERNIMPRVSDINLPEDALMGVALEGSTEAWPGAASVPHLDFTRFGQQSRHIEVFARGKQGFALRAACIAPWVLLQSSSDSLTNTKRQSQIEVSIDWSKIRGTEAKAQIMLHGAGSSQMVEVSAKAPTGNFSSGSYLEGDGVIAIEAEHMSRRGAANGVKWETIPGYGRTLSGVEPNPVEFKSFEPGSGARLEYDVTTFTSGKATLDVVVGPSLAFQPGHGLRFALAFDNDAPQIVDASTIYLSREWERSVSDSVHHVRTDFNLLAGRHTLKVWAIDPGVVIERLVLDLGGLKPSYLGPPESLRAGFAMGTPAH